LRRPAPLRELDYFPAWIEAGYHGEMEYLAKTNDAGELRRAALANVAPWARSVVVCAANYNSDAPYSTECADPSRGWISRYAFVESDYHEVLLGRLRRIEQRMVERIVSSMADSHASPRTWCYVDTGPVAERVLAAHSGIGWIGKNGCI
jgi:epoxyqueuosine reductase